MSVVIRIAIFVLISNVIIVKGVPLNVLPTACSADEADRPIPKYVQRSYDEDVSLHLAGKAVPVIKDFKTLQQMNFDQRLNSEELAYRVPCPCRYRDTKEKALDDCAHPRIKSSCKVMSIRTNANFKKYRCCFPSSRMLRLD